MYKCKHSNIFNALFKSFLLKKHHEKFQRQKPDPLLFRDILFDYEIWVQTQHGIDISMLYGLNLFMSFSFTIKTSLLFLVVWSSNRF